MIHFIPCGQNVLSITPSKSTIHVRIGKYTIDASYEKFMLPEPGTSITFTVNWATKNTPHGPQHGNWGGCDEVNNTYLAVLVTPDLLVGGSLAPGFKSPDPCRGEKHAVICCVGRVGKKYIPVCLE